MINSVSNSSAIAQLYQQTTQQTAPQAKPKAPRQDSVHLSPQAQKAVDADHDGDSR